MPRCGPGDVRRLRQRQMFGVDGLERLVFDIAAQVVRLSLGSPDNVHVRRLKDALIEYEDKQGSEWNGVDP